MPHPRYNNGYDDKEGHYIVLAGEEILNRYVVQEVLGKGSFGTVVSGFDEKYQESVAIKITRGGNYFYQQAKLEVDILIKLNNLTFLEDLVVKLRKVFMWQGHLVLVFELLSFNLYQLLKCTKFNGVSLDLTRKFGYQLLQVLRELERHKPPIIHCDLKPENVLLRDKARSGIRVIDFGSACYYSTTPRHKYIQSRFYRSPEVILELPYNTAIDRWSLGCMLVEFHTGNALFPGRSEQEQLQRFTAVLGPLPDEMIAASSKATRFYNPLPGGGWVLKEPPRPDQMTSLEKIIGVTTGGPRGVRANQPGHDEASYQVFLNIVKGFLTYDPNQRLGCSEALHHEFLAPLLALEHLHAQQRTSTTTTTAAPNGVAASAAVPSSAPGGGLVAAPNAVKPSGDTKN